MEVLQNINKPGTTCDPAIPLLGIDPQEMKSVSLTDTCAMFIVAFFKIGNHRNTPKCLPTDEWIKKTWHNIIEPQKERNPYHLNEPRVHDAK